MKKQYLMLLLSTLIKMPLLPMHMVTIQLNNEGKVMLHCPFGRTILLGHLNQCGAILHPAIDYQKGMLQFYTHNHDIASYGNIPTIIAAYSDEQNYQWPDNHLNLQACLQQEEPWNLWDNNTLNRIHHFIGLRVIACQQSQHNK